VRFYFTGTEFLYDYNVNLSKAVVAKKLPLTIWCSGVLLIIAGSMFCNIFIKKTFKN